MWNKKVILSLTVTMVSTLVVLTIFEIMKQYFHADIIVWKSHAITIIFSSSLSTIAVFFIIRHRQSLLNQLYEGIMERQQTNQQLVIQTEKLETLNTEMKLLGQMVQLLQSCQSVEDTSSVITSTMQQLFPDNSGALFIFRNSRNLLELVGEWNNPPLQAPTFAPDDCWALRLGHEHLSTNAAAAVTCKHVKETTSTYMCTPMIAQGEVMGSLCLTRGDKSRSPDSEAWLDEKKLIVRNVTEQIGLALWNIKLRKSLWNLSIRDPLTGLFNRRFMEEALEREFHRSKRQNISIGIIMLDLDHFKILNDTFGHEAGDTVLREMGQLLQKNIRGSDIACRYGGEEFLLIMPEASLQVTLDLAERVKEQVRKLNIVHANNPLCTITMSAGVAAYPDHGSTGEAVLHAADNALYKAKNSGRDRISIAEASV